MDRERRARLPGADELFRATGPRPPAPSDEQPAAKPVEIDKLALAQLGELAAAEDGAMSGVRSRVGPNSGLPSPPVGALITWAAVSADARAVVEVGASAGLTGLWLLRGMSPKGVLTSIEADPHQQGLAAQAFADAGANERVRTILGEPVDVLSRLSDHAYDLVLLHRVGPDHQRLLEHARRLLRPGGSLVAVDVAAGSHDDLKSRRALVQTLIDDDRVQVAVLPIDGGVALARFLDGSRLS